MHLSKELLIAIRNCELKLHCLKVRIWQNIDGGIKLSGHGTIEQNKFGSLYIEFVQTEIEFNFDSGTHRSFVKQFPDDSFDEFQTIFAEFELLNGEVFTSEGFSLKINLLNRQSNQVMFIGLPFIKLIEQREGSNHSENFLYYEINEKVDLPANKINKVKSTRGYESSSKNETEIVQEYFKLNIYQDDKHTEIIVKGNFEANDIIDSVNFYLGFSCGIMPQPYLQLIKVGEEKITIIKSINNQKSHQTLLNVIPSYLSVDGKANGSHSYLLFNKINELKKDNAIKFLSLYSQWERVWYGFTSVNEISELVLSVAIEGLLNDVFIPTFKKTRIDEQQTEEIKDIKAHIASLSISPEHINRLSGSVSFWGNITAKKALDILEEEGVISIDDKKIWGKLRNRCAHPKVKESNSAEEQRRRDEVLSCLDLFNKLILNALSYSGAVNFVSSSYNEIDTMSVVEHKELLNLS
jgi:hypothetical protein